MAKARVLFSQAHKEDFPAKFIENLPEAEILYGISSQPLNSETLNGYTCIALINPKTPLSDEEKGHIVKYKEKGGGVFLTFSLLNESQYEGFEPNNDLIKSMFNVDLVAKRILPEIEFGDFDLEYKRMFEANYRTRQKIKADGENVTRIIKYVPKLFPRAFANRGFEIKEISDFISFFSGAEKSRVILEREISPIPNSFYLYYLRDYTKLPVGYFGEDYFLEDEGFVDVSKRDKHYISKESWKLLKRSVINEFSTYENIGVITDISQPGRGTCLCAYELFDVIEKEKELAKTCQNFLQGILIWNSELAEKIRVLEERPTEAVSVVPQPVENKELADKPLAVLKYKELLETLERQSKEDLPSMLGLNRPASDVQDVLNEIKRNLTSYLFSFVGTEKKDSLEEDDEEIWHKTLDLERITKNKPKDERLNEDDVKIFREYSYNLREYVKDKMEEQKSASITT